MEPGDFSFGWVWVKFFISDFSRNFFSTTFFKIFPQHPIENFPAGFELFFLPGTARNFSGKVYSIILWPGHRSPLKPGGVGLV